jgi:uncharacterized membrane protein
MLPCSQALFSTKGVAVMYIERFVRHVGFGLVALVVLLSVGFTFEYLPVINALAR